jgi:putative transposase
MRQAILEEVKRIRQRMPRLGTRKIHYLLKDSLPVGRDRLFRILAAESLLIRRKKRYIRTTDSRHWMHTYKDHSKELLLQRPEQLWVADITYVRTKDSAAYLHLVTDAYSKRIMGYTVSKDLTATSTQAALEMALRNRHYPRRALLHHSDRGLQYCSSGYVQTLQDHHCMISMTQSGSPYDNAVAERVNGILKDEFSCDEVFDTYDQAKQFIDQAIMIYNTQRPHLSCSMLTPMEMHWQDKLKVRQWKHVPH